MKTFVYYKNTHSISILRASKQCLMLLSLVMYCLASSNFSQIKCPENNKNCLDNGIGFSDPKIFDNRSLMIMLEELYRQLQSIRVVDQKSLVDSLGLSQGYQSSDVSRSFEIGMEPIPAVKTTRKPDSAGNLSISEEVSDQKEFSGQTPSLPDGLATPKYEPNFGTSSEDLLTQQINLTYRIFNLRMLLERSISDRLVVDSTDAIDVTKNGSKLQAVLGLNVKLNPPKDSKDMAAFVELKVTVGDDKKPVSLVAMMPQEKTYNTSALSTKSNAFGGSAVFKMFTVGYSERRRGQTFYLYQDADTITFQPMGQASDLTNESPTFGWEFRPVLGRRSVSPGERQLFAVISLNQRDLFENTDISKLNVAVRTYWRKYSRKTLTVSNEEFRSRSFENKSAVVPTTSRFQNNLKPIIKKVKWLPSDNKSGVLSLEGESFFTGTNVLIGNKVYDNPTNGLTIKSDQSLQIATDIDAIGAGEIVINGRYGSSDSIIVPSKTKVNGVEMDSMSVESLSDNTKRLKILLRNKGVAELNTIAKVIDPNEGQLEISDIKKQGFPPIFLINNIVIPL